MQITQRLRSLRSRPQRVRRTPRSRPPTDWRTAAAAYLADPHRFWGPDAPRHADKVEAKKRALRERDGLDDRDIVDAVVSMAAKRRRQRPPPVYVTGLGGSGSHWVAGMLNDLRGLVAAGEVYLPTALLEHVRALPAADQACVVDALHLLHGWPRAADVWASSVVNCAAGVGRLRRCKAWDPDAVAIHLVRDPRDQVLSVTFRKRGFRRYEDPGASDAEYLRRMARRNLASYERSLAVADLIDIRCRYEDLCAQPRPLLRQVQQALGHPVDEAAIDRAAAAHDATAIRAAGGAGGSNLDAGGRARGWRESTDPAQQRTLHMYLADVVDGLGYPLSDCMGTPLPDHSLPARTLRFAGGAPGLLAQRVDGAWRRLDDGGGGQRAGDGGGVAAGHHGVAVAAGAPVLLRIGRHHGDLSGLARCGRDDVQALCLAANDRAGDTVLANLAHMTGLRTLDLARTAVTDVGLAHLHGMHDLQQLHLAGTATTPAGRARLAARLPALTIWV